MNIQLEELKFIKDQYRTTVDRTKVVSEFYEPCLRLSKCYYRAAGFYSSGSLLHWVKALIHFKDPLKKVKLLTSPLLSNHDQTLILDINDENEKLKFQSKKLEEIIDDASTNLKHPNISNIFKWLIANEKLEIRFALPKHTINSDDFHDKYGIFEFDNDTKIAFDGSANETLNGLLYKSETIPVHRSWINDEVKRINTIKNNFDLDWNGNNNGLEIKTLPEALRDKIFKTAPNEIEDEIKSIYENYPIINKNTEYFDSFLNITNDRYLFQKKIRDKFIKKKNGYLELATGTGKTYLALGVLAQLFTDNSIDKAIIVTPGNALTYQWKKKHLSDFIKSRRNDDHILYVSDETNKNRKKEIKEFFLAPTKNYKHILLTNASDYIEILKEAQKHPSDRTLLIFDEVHRLPEPKRKEQTQGLHSIFGYKMGLSATIENEYDPEQKNFIVNEIGDCIAKYDLKDAIKDGVLSPFNYHCFEYSLNSDELAQIRYLITLKDSKDANKRISDEVFAQRCAKVHGKAINKREIIIDYFNKNKKNLEYLNKSFLFFLEHEDYRDLINFFNQYIKCRAVDGSSSDEEAINDFRNGVLDSLLLCKKASEGISIDELNSVFLFHTDASRRMTIQRLGRALRIGENKTRANVFDFILVSNDGTKIKETDQKRREWLADLAKI